MKKSCACLALCLLAAVAGAQTKLEGLSANVDVKFDEYGIPHIFAAKWTDACRALGYLHASDRMMQMEITRRRASGTLAELMGKDALADDILVRQLGLRRTCEQFWKDGKYPDEFRADLDA
ncbi:MAG: penicillin acylase family protein, partial [Candidatus Hydrogenedentes bacterium]|nr:penicillin acylase family protein [Candidatus Hydrogenedentota bacterium]